MTFSQGDIVLLPFPMADLSGTKVRPAIIISNAKVNNTQDVIVAQITSNIRNDDFSFILEDSILTSSLNKLSEVRCHKILTVTKAIIKKKISSVKPEYIKELINKVKSIYD